MLPAHSQAYSAYAVVRDTVAETASWSSNKAYSLWAHYMVTALRGLPPRLLTCETKGYGTTPQKQESNLTLLKDLFGPTLVRLLGGAATRAFERDRIKVDPHGRAINTEDALGQGFCRAPFCVAILTLLAQAATSPFTWVRCFLCCLLLLLFQHNQVARHKCGHGAADNARGLPALFCCAAVSVTVQDLVVVARLLCFCAVGR